MKSAAKSFTSLSQPVLLADVWTAWSAPFQNDFLDLQGAGYRVRTDDIQLGNITLDRVNPERNESNPFTPPPKGGPSPTVKGFAVGTPKGDDAGGFGAGDWTPPLRPKGGRAGTGGGAR